MPKGYHHVTRDIRSQIYALKSTGTSLRKIATVVGYHVSTISREIKRTSGGRGYRYKQATIKAEERRSNASKKSKRLTLEVVTKQTVQDIADRLNNRPRKILNYKTPAEVLMMHNIASRSFHMACDGYKERYTYPVLT